MAAMIASGMLARSIDYESTVAKHLAWALHCGTADFQRRTWKKKSILWFLQTKKAELRWKIGRILAKISDFVNFSVLQRVEIYCCRIILLFCISFGSASF